MTTQADSTELQTTNACCQSNDVSHCSSDQETTQQTPQVSIATVRPRVELRENEASYSIRAEMPGIDKNSVSITIERDLLTLAGEPAVDEQHTRDVVYREFRTRRYERTFRLSDDVDRSNVKAIMNAGLLTVTLPKLPVAQPVKVEVSAS